MGVKVYKGNIKVEKFQFGQIISEELKEGLSEFKLNSLNKVALEDPVIKERKIRNERIAESASSFMIDERVREYRGIREQEIQDYEKRVRDEVNRQVDALKQKAYEEGFEAGKSQGHSLAYEEAHKVVEEKINMFAEQIEQALGHLHSVYDKNKNDAYSMVKNLTKWVILKEVDDSIYLERLLEKLILEIKTKNNLLIRVNESAFQYMPEIIEKVQARVGKLTNVRTEIELDMQDPGIILESENGIIDGTLEAQFSSLDKLFENIGVVNSNES